MGWNIASGPKSTLPKMPGWKKNDGNKRGTGIGAEFRGLEIYTSGYIEVEKESLIRMESEEKRNRIFELLEREVREAAEGIRIPQEL